MELLTRRISTQLATRNYTLWWEMVTSLHWQMVRDILLTERDILLMERDILIEIDILQMVKKILCNW